MEIPEVDCAEALRMRAAGAAWIDVREPDEWVEARIPDTELVPLGEAVEALPRRFSDRTARVVISCRSGARSGRLVAHLRAQGYRDVHNLRGGILAWAREGRPVEHG